jgi:hypothetical protein
MIRKRDISFIAVVLGIVGFLMYLSSTGEERFISRIEPHLRLVGVEDVEQADAECLSCHGGGAVPGGAVITAPVMPENHPLRKKNCRQCHRLERKKP